MRTIALTTLLLLANVSLVRANPIIMPPDPVEVNSLTFIPWCVLGTLLMFSGRKRLYAAFVPFVFGCIALLFGISEGLLICWAICLVGMVFWLAIRKPATRDWDWIRKFSFHVLFIILMVVVYYVPEPNPEYGYVAMNPDDARAIMTQHLLTVISIKAGTIAAFGAGIYLCRKVSRSIYSGIEPQNASATNDPSIN